MIPSNVKPVPADKFVYTSVYNDKNPATQFCIPGVPFCSPIAMKATYYVDGLPVWSRESFNEYVRALEQSFIHYVVHDKKISANIVWPTRPAWPYFDMLIEGLEYYNERNLVEFGKQLWRDMRDQLNYVMGNKR